MIKTMNTATCECGLLTDTIANMTSDQHVAAHREQAEPWVTFTTFRLPNGRLMLAQKRNGSSRTVPAR
jgi:hypothetical protein